MIAFGNLTFLKDKDRLLLDGIGCLQNLKSCFAQVQIAGENKNSHMGAKMGVSSEGDRLKLIDIQANDCQLTVLQQSPSVQVVSCFSVYGDTNAVRIETTVKNILDTPIVLEEVSSFFLSGFGDKSKPDDWHFTKFLQSHHAECQPQTNSFRELGLWGGRSDSQTRAGCGNIGSWSTKEALPMGILEGAQGFLMFQIESSNSWYYEISDRFSKYYLYLGGANLPFGGWSKQLQPGESYTAPAAAIAFGEDLNHVLGEMTKYRRHIAGTCHADKDLPVIFNEYMHLSWDSPTAENTAKYAPVAAKVGAKYYVIDCGWHNEEDGDKVYPYVGHWQESKARFPEGVKKTTDFIRSLGMKPGLWIEPEIIGIRCEDMLAHYDEDCFFSRYGKRLSIMDRHFLDYRNPKVRGYMTQTVDRMINDYGAQYIKFDYNQDCGIGTDREAFTPGEGLEKATDAFYAWLNEIMHRYPDVIFEGCASGGMRMDYKALSYYSLISTSDQTDYLLYPYIAGNVLSAVLPEQAAVWSYPADSDCQSGADISDDRIVINMVNSFLGRMHLASHLDKLNHSQLCLIKEGVDYYNSLSPIKKQALPYFPLGFTGFGAETVCAGFRNEKNLYLALWKLKNAPNLTIPMPGTVSYAKIAYPSKTEVLLSAGTSHLDVFFPEKPCAVFIEVGLF